MPTTATFRTKTPFDGTAQNYWFAAPSGAAATLLLVDQTAYFVPIWVDKGFTFDRIGVDISTAAGASGVLRIGLYADATDAWGNLPGALITDYATFVTTGSTVVTLNTPSAAVNLAGSTMYWVALVGQGAPSPQVTVRSSTPSSSLGSALIPVAAGSSTPTLGAVQVGGGFAIAAFASGALPTTISNALMNALAPAVTLPRVILRTTAG